LTSERALTGGDNALSYYILTRHRARRGPFPTIQLPARPVVLVEEHPPVEGLLLEIPIGRVSVSIALERFANDRLWNRRATSALDGTRRYEIGVKRAHREPTVVSPLLIAAHDGDYDEARTGLEKQPAP